MYTNSGDHWESLWNEYGDIFTESQSGQETKVRLRINGIIEIKDYPVLTGCHNQGLIRLNINLH